MVQLNSIFLLINIYLKPLKFEVKKKLFQRSERVKSVEFHPENTWILAALYSGNACIYDYSTSVTIF